MTEWHEDDAFWQAMKPAMFNEAIWETTSGQIDALVELVGLEPGADVLDLACGPGRHSLELARRGFGVTGVDRTESYLDEAESRAASEGLDIEWVCEDMREFQRDDAYDLAVVLYSSLGFFEEREANLEVLRRCRRSLRDGAPLVLEMMGKEIVARDFNARTWEELEDGSLFLEQRRPSEGWTRMENRWIRVHPDGARETYELEIRMYSGTESQRLLEDAGFASVEIHGSLEGGPYDQRADRLVAVAR